MTCIHITLLLITFASSQCTLPIKVKALLKTSILFYLFYLKYRQNAAIPLDCCNLCAIVYKICQWELFNSLHIRMCHV